MVDTLIGLIILIIVIGIVIYLLRLLINLIPMDESFKQIAWVLILLVAVLIILAKVLPLLNIHSPI